MEEPACSARTIGRVHALMGADSLRDGIHHVYQRLKRNKALPDIRATTVAVLDGTESHASYLRYTPTAYSEPSTLNPRIAFSSITVK